MAKFLSFLNKFRSGSASAGVTAVEFRADGIALAHVENHFGSPSVTQCLFLPGESAESTGGGLKDMVKSLGFSGGSCVLVLSSNQYNLAPVEAPDVPEHEQRDAVRWSLGDMVNFPIDQAAVDIFPVPEDAQRGGKRSLFAVAASREEVRPMLNCLKSSGLEVGCIDVTHLALRNLVERVAGPGQAIAALLLGSSASNLAIFRDGNLYLSRPMNFSTRLLGAQGNQVEIALTQLVGELKRSLDYFEVQMRQEPVNLVALVPLEENGELVIERLSSDLGSEMDVVELNLPDVVPCDTGLPAAIQHHCAVALGAALRPSGELHAPAS